MERRLIEAILSVVSLAKEREKFRAYEFLLEKASRYSHSETCSFLSLEGQGSSFSFYGGKKEVVVTNRDLVAFEGPSYVNGKWLVDPLRVIWADWREGGVSIDLEEGTKKYDGRALLGKDVERVLEEEKMSVLGLWINGSFVKLCHCLGMPTEGFEGEFRCF